MSTSCVLVVMFCLKVNEEEEDKGIRFICKLGCGPMGRNLVKLDLVIRFRFISNSREAHHTVRGMLVNYYSCHARMLNYNVRKNVRNDIRRIFKASSFLEVLISSKNQGFSFNLILQVIPSIGFLTVGRRSLNRLSDRLFVMPSPDVPYKEIDCFALALDMYRTQNHLRNCSYNCKY